MANRKNLTTSGPAGKPPVVSDNRKPAKPYPGFPLTPRADGRFCKKILGTVHIFGSKGGAWQEALGACPSIQFRLKIGADVVSNRRIIPISASVFNFF